MTALDPIGPSPRIPAVAGFAAVAPVRPTPPPAPGSARFVGDERAYWRLMGRGAALLVVTLGIYRFWLATDQRRFLWANSEIAGDTLEYTGTARELLIGFLIAIAVLIPIYAGLFLASLELGAIGELSGVIAFVLLTLFGQFAIYRARRYRLTRTVFRGVRLHQTGSAWVYALYSMAWWIITIATLGLAYPWGQANLERYKMGHTYYGDLRGRFAATGTRLFVRGIGLWFLLMGPLVASLVYAVSNIDWKELAEAVELGDNVVGNIESASPNFATALGLLVMAPIWFAVAAGLLYPAFQAMTLRWWTSGVRVGEMAVTSRLRTSQMYGLYLRFLGYLMLFGLGVGVASALAIGIFLWLFQSIGNETLTEIGGTVGAMIGYVLIMLGYWLIYQVTARLRIWRLSFETVELSSLEALAHVKAAGAPSSAFGEGLADALDVGGL